MFGYHGQYLKVDAGSGRSELRRIPELVLRRFLGGVGLGTWIVANETPAGTNPLDPAAALVFALSPLVGSPLTTSAKFAVVALSPLTGRLCDALSSSHFALAAKRAGVDALAIVGRRAEPSLLFIDGLGRDGPAVRWESAAEVWGLPASEAEVKIRKDFGSDWQVSAVGPAGERLIPFATISHDGRHAGRGGLGAVLGSKRIKAVAVRGDRRTPTADPARTVELARDLSARSFGPATQKYRELGTLANLLVFNRFDALPTRNFQAGSFATVEQLASVDLGPARRVARHSCASCSIGCEHIYELAGRGRGVRMEYESLYALGPLCGVDDPAFVLRASAACDAAGIDTISTGGTIAFLMECVERGWVNGRLDGTGRTLRFGDGQAVLDAIADLIDRRGELGRLLAMGSRCVADRIGLDSNRLAPHVKGLELPGYHPATLHAMALGLAVGTRGADHNRSGAYEADFSDRPRDPASVAAAAIETEDRSALIDSLILCKFLRGAFHDLYAESASLIAAVTGWDVSGDELRTVARRVVVARKCVNQREGWTPVEDTLPARLLDDAGDGSAPTALTRARLDALIAAYNETRGWDADGRVSFDLRCTLGLGDDAFGPPGRSLSS